MVVSATHLHVELTEPLCGVDQFLLDLFPGPLGRLQASSQLLHLSLHEAQPSLLEAVLLPQLVVLTGVLVHLHLQILGERRGRERITAVAFTNHMDFFLSTSSNKSPTLICCCSFFRVLTSSALFLLECSS